MQLLFLKCVFRSSYHKNNCCGFFLGKTSRKHSGVQNVAELVEILGIYELYRSPTIFLSSSNISWMNSLPFACWQEVWTCRFFELKQRSYEAHSVEKSAKKCKKFFSWNQISEGIKSSTTTTQTYFSNFKITPFFHFYLIVQGAAMQIA